MPIPERYRELVEKYKNDVLASLEDLAELHGSPSSPEEKERLWESELWRLALARADEPPPVPEAVTAELIGSTPPGDLLPLLSDYVGVCLQASGSYRHGDPRFDALESLPAGLRVVYTVLRLDGEVRNSGFERFLLDFRRRIARQALRDLETIDARGHASVAERALDLLDRIAEENPLSAEEETDDCHSSTAEKQRIRAATAHVQERFGLEFDRLRSEWAAIEEIDPLHEALERYVRGHVEACVHERPVA